MSDVWFPGADLSRKAPIDGGSILGGKPKCLWHDTETLGVPSYSTGFFPNMTIHEGRPYQHIPADRASRALKNISGGVQTNRWNVFQIEICGFANEVQFHSVMRDVAQWLNEVRGTPLISTVEWRSYPSSFGDTPVRLSPDAWSVYEGHLAHMHAPENVHGDPGWPFPIDQILHGETEDELTDPEWERLEKLVDLKMRHGVRYVDHGEIETTGANNNLKQVREDLKGLAARLSAIELKLGGTNA